MILPAHTVLTKDEAFAWLYRGGQYVHLDADDICYFLEKTMWSIISHKGDRYRECGGTSYGWIMFHAIRTGKAPMLFAAEDVAHTLTLSHGHVCAFCGAIERDASFADHGDIVDVCASACGWVEEDGCKRAHVACSKCARAVINAQKAGYDDINHALANIFTNNKFRKRVKDNAARWKSFRFNPLRGPLYETS